MSAWFSDPIEAHRQWRDGLVVADRAYATQSQRLYRSLFGVFARWMSGQGLTLQTITNVDLARFLETLSGRNGRPPSPRTQRTYAAEIDRVMAHIQAVGLRLDNPARSLVDTMKLTTRLKPRSIYFPPKSTREAYLASLAGFDPQALTPEAVRAHAMNLLMLECGLTLKEVQKLTLNHIATSSEAVITAPGHRTLKARTVPMSPITASWLAHWLAVRASLHVISPSDYKARAFSTGVKLDKPKAIAATQARVFVTLAGKSDHTGGLRQHRLAINRIRDEVIYTSASLVFTGGKEVDHEELATLRERGPQTLRNMCCARLVAEREPTENISHILGLNGNDQVWAMQRAMGVTP